MWEKHDDITKQLTEADADILLDNREECFEKLNEDLIAVLQLKADVVGFYPCQVLQKHTGRHVISPLVCATVCFHHN